MKKAAYEFDRDIVRAAVDSVRHPLKLIILCSMACCICVMRVSIDRSFISQHTGKIVSEKVIKYFEERLKSRVSSKLVVNEHIDWLLRGSMISFQG